ncbi:hypothetical protein QJQ45_016734, partial [Haematococcus lacustris]
VEARQHAASYPAYESKHFLPGQRRAQRDVQQRREKAAEMARAHLVRQLLRVEREGEAEEQAVQHLGEAAALAGVGAREQGAQQSLLVSAVLDQYYGDRSSFYFYHRDQPVHAPTLISSLQLPGQPGQPTDLTTPAGVKAACWAFQQHYSAAEPTGVYAAKPVDTAARATLLGSLTSHFTPTQARAAEGPDGSPMLSEEELGRALQGCAHSKAPGLDGLPMEVYDRLWVELGRPLRAMLQEALTDTTDPAPLAEFLTGIITLVPKAGKPRDQVAGYRPITLLNCDVRLVARAVEDRLQLPLDLLVSPSQSAFILGRNISDSVQFHLGLLEYLQQRGSPAWLLLLDLAGAYDNVSWGLLQDTMEAMGFCREGHVRWARLLHRGATSQCIVLQPLVSYLGSLQLAGRISTPTIPSSPLAMHRAALTPALPSKEYADDLTIVVLDRVRDGKVVVEALGLFRAAGGPALSVSKSSALPCAQPEPGPGNQEGSGPEGAGRGGRGGDGGEGGGQGQVGAQRLGGGPKEGGGQGQQQGGREQGGEREPEVVIPAVRVGVPVRHLGVPLGAPSYAATSEAAFGGAAAAMMASSLPWQPQGLNLLGRVQVAQQCLASKSIYQMAFVQPSAALAQAMALAVNRFVAASDLPQERSPNSSRLYPSKAICVMPRGEGGVGLPDLGVTSTAMLAKMLAQLWSPRVRPWQPLTRSLMANPSHGLSTWVITDPTAPPSRGISPRLQAHVAALAELKLFRAVPPASQSFFSVLAETLWYNAQVRMNPAAREAAAEQGWTHVRHVREALHSPQLEGEAHWAADLVRACLPEPWQGMVDRLQPPQPEWECLRVGPGVGFVMRRTPLLQPSHWVGPNGRLYPLDPTVQGPLGAFGAEEGAAWEPAAVARLNKPSYRLTPEERATHLRPLPAQRHMVQEQAQGQELGGARGAGMGLFSKSHPYKRQGGQAARCACCVRSTPAGSTGWVEIRLEGEAASYRSGCNHTAIGQVTAMMSEVIRACSNLEPRQVPLAHRSCAEAAAAAHAVCQQLRGQEPASQLQPMPRLSSTPTQAPAQPGPAHAPCPHHLPDQPPSHPSQSQLQGSSQHHPALSAPLHLPGLSILTRPATNPVTSPAKEQQPIIHTTEDQDEQTMPPSMPKQQQDWATARCAFHSSALTCTSPALHQPCPGYGHSLTFAKLPCPSLLLWSFEAMPMFDQSFDSVKQLCTLGKKLSVKMLNEYCKAVGLCVPANTLRADLRYMLDPQVWGMGTTTLLDFSVKHARVRLHQLQRVSADPLYPPSGGLWPALWGVRPPRAAGESEEAPVADGALRELELKWEASAQQVADQGAAGEREQQGRDVEERLAEEVQGSQPPRWLDTSARAHQRPSPQMRAAPREAEEQAAQHLGEAAALAGVGAREQGAQQSLLVSAVLDQYYGDRSSFYFYHRDQPVHAPTLISSLQLPGQPGQPTDLTTPAGVKAACWAFQQHYSAAEPTGVYAAKPVDTAARATLLGSLTSHFTPTQARAAEGPDGSPMLSEEELGRALQGCAHSKAPGLDGLPMEVYDRLWVELGRPLRAMLQEALTDTTDPAPMAEFLTGIITLVPKAGKPRDQVAGYRPITLLNCDVRLVARAVEDRLQLPLDLLVSPSQSAFILGRDISDSVQFHLGLLEYLQQRGSPAWLLLLDLAGAYDNVSWGLLQDTMEAMGFCREGHVRWARLLHRGATSQCIVLQPLVSYLGSLQLAGRISTPTIPSNPLAMHRAALTPALPSKEYADDLTIVVLDRVRDGKVVVEALGLFRAAGGPALSVSKSSALPCAQPEPGPGNQEGSGPEGAGRGGRGGDGGEGGGQGQVGAQRLGGGPKEGGGQGQQQGGREQGGEREPEVVIPAVRVGVPVRHLGVPLGAPSYAATREAAFGGAAAAMMASSLPWRPQGLNLLGRVQVAQQCLASKSIYQMAFVQPSAALAQAMALAVNRFVAASDLPQERSPNSSRLYPSKAICVMPRGEGGVGLPDVGVTSTAMLAKMLAQLWSPRVRPWQPLCNSPDTQLG